MLCWRARIAIVGTAAALCMPVLTASGPAFAKPKGFRATSVARMKPARGQDVEGRLDYGHHRLRIDRGNDTTSIVDLKTGAFTMIHHPLRAYAVLSLERMKRERDEARQQTLARIEKMPPGTRNRLRAQMAAQDAAMSENLRLKATGASERVDDQLCRVVRWSSPQGQGQACLKTLKDTSAKDWRGASLKAFAKDADAFRAQLRSAGIGSGALALPVLLLAQDGFPLRIVERIRFGASMIESTTEYKALTPRTFPAAHFQPPKDYRERDFSALMAAMQSVGRDAKRALRHR